MRKIPAILHQGVSFQKNKDELVTPLDLQDKIRKECLVPFLQTFLGCALGDTPLEDKIIGLYEHLIGWELEDFLEGEQRKKIRQKIKNEILLALKNILNENNQNPQNNAPKVLGAIGEFDAISRDAFSGHKESFLGFIRSILEDLTPEFDKKITKKDCEQFDGILQKKAVEKIHTALQDAENLWTKDLYLPINQKLGVRLKKTLDDLKNKNLPIVSEKSGIQITKTGRIMSLFSYLNEGGKEERAFLKVVLACIEGQKKDFGKLKEKTRVFEDNLFSDFNVSIGDVDKKWRPIKIKLQEREIVAQESSRAKSQERIYLKMLTKPNFDVTEVVTDGIGIRIEVQNKEDALALLQYFATTNGPLKGLANLKELEFESKNMFSGKNEAKTQEKIENMGFKKIKFVGNENPYFQDAKIRGKTLKKSAIGEENFEIQIVLTNNQNETGISHHAIYQNCQAAQAIARIFGYINETQLSTLEEVALEKSMDEKEELIRIKQEILQQGKTATSTEINKRFKQRKRGRLQAIQKRFRENLVAVEKDQYVFVDPKTRSHRLEGTGLLPASYEEIIRETRGKMETFLRTIDPKAIK